jgi:anti-anti-sigma factor
MAFSVQQDSDQRTFRLLGELDLATADQLIELLEPTVRRDGDLYLDLARLEFMDVAGIHALMKVRLDLCGRGKVWLRSPTGEVARVLELVGADAFLDLVIDGDLTS